jgi:tetratricopeptide (TPR) repeat protein
LDPLHPDLGDSFHNLAAALHSQGQPDQLSEAAECYRQASDIRRGLGPAATERRRGTLFHLADVLTRLARHAEAETALRELREVERASAEAPRLDATVLRLGECLLRQDKFADAETALREHRSFRQENLPGHFTARALLGWAMLGQKDYPAAESLLREAHRGFLARDMARPSTVSTQLLSDTTLRLVQLYDAWGQPDKAAEWREKLKGVDRSPAGLPGDS